MEDKMSYMEFKSEMLDQLASMLCGEGELLQRNVIKPNEPELTGVALDRKDGTPQPVAYLEELYQEYLEHGDFDATLEEAARMVSERPQNLEFSERLDLADCEDKLICRLIGVKQNQELLEQLPHVHKNDMAVVFHILLYSQGTEYATFSVDEQMRQELGMTQEELYEKALGNMARRFPAMTIPLAPQLTVITNKGLLFGATSMLYPEVLEQVAEKNEADLYILPSSIHEVMAVPDDGEISVAELREMVKKVNQTQVRPRDQLTDSVYRYDRGDGIIHLCKEAPRMVR